jgi:hypothetical protein
LTTSYVCSRLRLKCDGTRTVDCVCNVMAHGQCGRLRLKCDGTRAETRFGLSAKRTRPFKSAGATVQSNTGSRDMRIYGSNADYTMFRDSVKSNGYPLLSPVSPSLPLPCVTVCHQVSTGVYLDIRSDHILLLPHLSVAAVNTST